MALHCTAISGFKLNVLTVFWKTANCFSTLWHCLFVLLILLPLKPTLHLARWLIHASSYISQHQQSLNPPPAVQKGLTYMCHSGLPAASEERGSTAGLCPANRCSNLASPSTAALESYWGVLCRASSTKCFRTFTDFTHEGQFTHNKDSPKLHNVFRCPGNVFNLKK